MSDHDLHAKHHDAVDHEPQHAKQEDPGGSAYQQVVAVARNGNADPARIAQIIERSPHEQARIIQFLHASMGNGFVQQVLKLLNKDEHPVDKPDDGQIHIITEAGLRHLRQDGAKGAHAARELYDNPDAYIVLKAGQQMPEGWKGNATMLFPSYASFEAAANSGALPKNLKAVVYDNEHWEQTPPNEKHHAAEFAKKFRDLAHGRGLTFIAAPTQKWFPEDARYADIIDVQLQDRESHTRSYAKTLEHDANVAHHYNKDEKVVGQITSSVRHLDPSHQGHVPRGIRAAEKDVVDNAPNVDGFWGYTYQQNDPSIRAGDEILEDLADKKKSGAKI